MPCCTPLWQAAAGRWGRRASAASESRTLANAAGQQMAPTCLDHGLIFQLRGTPGDLNVIRLVPPMTTTEAEVDRAMSILYDAIKAV